MRREISMKPLLWLMLPHTILKHVHTNTHKKNTLLHRPNQGKACYLPFSTVLHQDVVTQLSYSEMSALPCHSSCS